MVSFVKTEILFREFQYIKLGTCLVNIVARLLLISSRYIVMYLINSWSAWIRMPRENCLYTDLYDVNGRLFRLNDKYTMHQLIWYNEISVPR